MKTIIKLSIFILILITFQACSQKIQIKAIKASKLTNKNIKYISVDDFKADTISQATQIQTALSNVTIDGKHYFHLANRKNANKILEEQKLKDSGLVDLVDDEQIKGLQEVKALLTGEVILNDKSKSNYYEQRTDYSKCIQTYTKKGKTYCKKYRKYNVYCQSNIYNVKTKINIINIANGATIYNNTYGAKSKYAHCSDDKNILPSKNYVNTRLAKNISNQLIKDIAPSYVYFTAVLLDSVDIKLTSKQKVLFKSALKLINLKRLKKANHLLKKLNFQVHNSSYVILYDLALTTESMGNLDKALHLLELAEDIALSKDKDIKEISKSINRIKHNIIEKNKSMKQL
jgi:curli biogenesis system outer membrane secretion channel CsgG